MRKISSLLVIAVLLSQTVPALAKDSGDPAKIKAEKEAAEKRLKLRKSIDTRKTDINGTEWPVTLNSGDKAEKPVTDTLTFRYGRVSSKFFSEKGFAPTNYTVTLPEGSDKAVWETMQTSSDTKEGIVFIRGEWLKNEMSGQVTQQLDGGKSTKEYYFTTKERKALAPEKAQAAQPAPKDTEKGGSAALVSVEAVASPVPAEATPAAPKKKRFGL